MSEKIAQRSVDAAPPQPDSFQEQTFTVAEDEGAAAAHIGPAPRSLAPLPGVSRQQTLSVGIFPGPNDRLLLASAWQEAADAPRHEFTWLPRSLLQQAAGNLLPFFVQTRQTDGLPAAPPWPQEARRASLQALLQEHDGELAPLLQLLAAALDERRLLLEGQARNTRSRIAVVQGLMALLPASARPLLGFASNVNEVIEDAPAILFSDADLDSSRWRAGDEMALPSLPGGHFVALLAQWWVGDLPRLLEAIDALGALAAGSELAAGLDQLAQQHLLGQRIESGQEIPSTELKALLGSGQPVAPALLPVVLERLLRDALDKRDSDAALLVAQQMDADPALDAELGAALAASLQQRPDAVYVFARARLAAPGDIEDSWCLRLQAAALCSLQIAICEADAATVVNWLRLIALEPDHYDLAEILKEGLLAVRERAHSDGELGLQLLELAVGHAPDVLDELLADADLLAALPDNVGLVLRDHTGDPLMTLQRRGPEFFLVAIARATQARVAGAISSAVLEQTWLLYRGEHSSALPAHFQPQAIVDAWLQEGAQWMPASALGNIASLLLTDRRDALFIDFAVRLAEQDLLAGALPDAAHRSQRSSADIVKVFGQLPADLSREIIADSCLALLRMRAWRSEALPAGEMLARLLQQHDALRLGDEALWHLLEFASETRSEMVAHAAARRLFRARCTAAPDAQLAVVLLRLQESLAWSSDLQLQLTTWWRAWARTQGTAVLSRVDDSLAASRPLAHKREVVQTILAFRRMLGTRNMSEFAGAIDDVYDLLQHLSAAFDPRNNQLVGFDDATIRAELDAQSSELSQNARVVLAHNLRELALLIGSMGDLRSRNTLVRQHIERQILTGEHAPESAVDALKWVAAWLEHTPTDEPDENGQAKPDHQR